MPIVANGTTITLLYINGVLCDTAVANGVDVYGVFQTTTPSVTYVSNDKTGITMRFTNNDANEVTMYADQDTTDPTTNRGTVQPSASLDIYFGGMGRRETHTFYAKAQAAGHLMSEIASADGTSQ